ncbi:MAG: RagB/SusD family nutrient uptake outer membrane protein [Candidatus Pseudobacter hemicellulosilyticus]|uniref:RagB/SusD family nutrient uptake outer membrane protein n=1 Tax=Candidatus Pseudobacter hemicellulosilyticus TaxID=3121375 RepID=A0AAJ6BH81_9BACT|nr:MAG: RagB/SusD family nutrient uptake outer membrane protein [Pseudobacter sp.]
MRYSIIALLVLTTGLLGGCKKFLDVKPKVEVGQELLFENEQGFMDALTGVYLKMNSDTLYGRELSFGLVDVLAKQHTRITSIYHEYYDLSTYNYMTAAARTKIDNLWIEGYGCIANLNNLLTNLETRDPKTFSGANYAVISGEAHALRAFLHFDLLRLFAPAPAAAGGNAAAAIPYMDRLTAEVFPQLKVEEVLQRVLADCEVAANALKAVDPVIPANAANATTSGYLRERPLKFNYYAVKALQARAYLYAGDKAKALACAEEVIQSNVFTWTPSWQISSGNRVLVSELIFALYKSNMNRWETSYFSTAGSSVLTRTNEAEFKTVYENISGDMRYSLLLTITNGTGLSNKYVQATSASTNYLKRMPVMRLSEMYYIAAECLAEADMTRAVGYLNTVRRNRNVLTDLNSSISTVQLQDELLKEYMKEFYCEGQLFFYYKRKNASSIWFSTVTPTNAIYVLPLPDNELEYGGR